LKSFITSAILSLALVSGCSSTGTSPAPAPSQPKNIIYLIGDGMSMAHLSAYRYFKNSNAQHVGLGDKHVPVTLFDRYFVGKASTLPDDETLVTDSAAGATALSSGIKTYNGAIALDNDKTPTLTLLQQAKRLGKTTATISTSQVTHATPASFLVHNESRRNETQIADSIFDLRIEDEFVADLMLGGGTTFFIRDDRNLTQEFTQAGYQYIDSLEQLPELQQLPALGLFAPKGLPYAIDHNPLPNRLTAMTKTALPLLKQHNDNGFVVMIEGSQIDWCSHGNDIACTMGEMADFEHTLEAVIEFAKQDGETLVVLTADHGTGGLTLGANSQYKWLPNVIHQVHASAEKMVKQMDASKRVLPVWQEHVEFSLDEEQKNKMQQLLDANDLDNLYSTLVKCISDRSFTGWTTTGHTGDDVAVIAFGVGAEQFAGHQDNTDIAKKLFGLLE